jgi:hypothetical protein
MSNSEEQVGSGQDSIKYSAELCLHQLIADKMLYTKSNSNYYIVHLDKYCLLEGLVYSNC